MNIEQAMDDKCSFYRTVEAVFEDRSEVARRLFSAVRCCTDDNKVVVSDIVFHGTDFLDIANVCRQLELDVRELLCLSAYLYAQEIQSKKTMFLSQSLSLVK
jgi:hypothetical protein